MKENDERRPIMAGNFDKEYYVMTVDGANNHPLLAWGKTRKSPFLKNEPIDETTLDLPLKIVFGEPYPIQYEPADFLMLGAQYVGSEKLKKLLERNMLEKIQFIQTEIESNKKEIIKGYFIIHFNRIRAIDEENYEGEEPNEFGNILDLKRFSLNEKLLESIVLEERLVFVLEEKSSMVIVHKTIYESIQKEELTGIKFFRVDEWDNNWIFREQVF